MNNLMIDLETMGKNKDAPIVSIGAVFFTPETGDMETSDKNSIRLSAWKVLWSKGPHLTAIPSCGG